MYLMDIQTLSDRAEIADLLALYCRGVDRRDEATLRSIYHEDAIEDRSEGQFIGPAQKWVGWALSVIPVFDLTQHTILNSLVEIEGDTAYGETYFNAYHRFGDPEKSSDESSKTDDIKWPESGMEMILAGRYLDRFERRDGVWKIAYRKMVCDWVRTQPIADQWFDENPSAYRSVPHISDARLDSNKG
jgi:hypothetical protein